jgi:hypothetical protein
MGMAELPDVLNRGTTIVVFGLGIGMIALHTALAAVAAQKQALSPRLRLMFPALVGGFLTLWLATAVTLGDRTNFPLQHEDVRLVLSLLLGFGPMLVGIVLLFSSGTLRRANAALPGAWLVWAQTYRVAGLMFLFPFLYYGVVPAGFAIPAGLGDFITGALAPFVGLAVARRRPNAFGWAVAWNLFGITDLIVAPAAAVLSGAQVIGLYPLSLIPLFLGPPLGILTHVHSLRNLALLSSRARADVSKGSRPGESGAVASRLRTT